MEKIENYIELSKKIENVVYSNTFYSISQIKKINTKDIKLIFKSLNKESEKKAVAFLPFNFPEEYIEFPVKYFKIIKKSKFILLEHKHYLGTILSLGIKREILGDLLIKNEVCYGIIMENIFQFLKENLKMIKTSPVDVVEIEENEVPKNTFGESIILVSSMRLDSLVSEISKISRVKVVEQILLGNIQVNYEIIREKDYKIEIGDIISIRKIGKFIIDEMLGMSKKNKIKILIKKYM